MATGKKRLPSSKRSAPVFRLFRFGDIKKYKEKLTHHIKRGVLFIDKNPLTAFFAVLGLIFLLIIVGSILRKPKVEEKPKAIAKDVATYSIGSAPTLKVQAQVEKSGIVKIVAQAPGIVSSINVSEGQEVAKGTVLANLSTNYQGGNAASVQRQVAAVTYQNTKDNYDTQKDLIAKQRELADKTDANADQLRDITSKSIDDTKSLLNLNQEIVSSLQSNLDTITNTNQNGANDAQILQTKQIISQYKSAVNQLLTSVRTSEYQASSDNPPANLSNLAREITQKQLDIQEKALSLSLEVSSLQLRLAQIQEATMYPAAPFAGVIERIYVNEGDAVNPGTPIALVHGEQTLKVIAKVTREIAQKMSVFDMATITIGGKSIKASPSYISTEATDGALYAVIFELNSEFQNSLSNKEFVTVELPVGVASTSTAVPFIPLDAIYQGTNGTYIFVVTNGKATARKIVLGDILGQYAEVKGGLQKGDQIILSRTVIEGDKVQSVE